MKKLLLSVAAIVSCLTLSAQNIKFTNPVMEEEWTAPTVVFNQNDGYFYSLATMDRGDCDYLISKDLVYWERSGQYPFTEETLEQLHAFGAKIKSPQIVKIKGKYLLYCSVFNSEEDSRIVVLSSPSLEEFFTFEGIVTDSKKSRIDDCVDPFVVSSNGQVWMFFGNDDGIYRTKLNKDGLKMARKNDFRHVAGLKESLLRAHDNVFSGCTLYKHKGYWYMFATAGRDSDYSYKIVVGRSKKLNGEFLDRDGNDMADGYANIILSSNPRERFYSPGHNCEIIKDNRGNTYTLYCCRTGRWGGKEDEKIPHSLMLQRVRWSREGWPYFDDDDQKKDKVCFRKK